LIGLFVSSDARNVYRLSQAFSSKHQGDPLTPRECFGIAIRTIGTLLLFVSVMYLYSFLVVLLFHGMPHTYPLALSRCVCGGVCRRPVFSSRSSASIAACISGGKAPERCQRRRLANRRMNGFIHATTLDTPEMKLRTLIKIIALLIGVFLASAGATLAYIAASSGPKAGVTGSSLVASGFILVAAPFLTFPFSTRLAKLLLLITMFAFACGVLWLAFQPNLPSSHPATIQMAAIAFGVTLVARVGLALRRQPRQRSSVQSAKH